MEEAVARRERLKALRDAAEGDNVEESPVSGVGPTLKFRNYAVRDEKHIQHEKVAAAQPPKFEEPVIEKKAVEILAQQDVLVNVAPKKANWDLKRDIEKKLDKLERRTQRAILETMQDEEAARLRDADRVDQED